jgi:hypothetical protein
MLGDMWSSLLETWRVGNGHMSYRGVRLPWARYRMPIYTAAAVIFWLASAAGARKFLPPPSSRAH